VGRRGRPPDLGLGLAHRGRTPRGGIHRRRAHRPSAASELGVSVNTVGTHLRLVFTKLGIQSRVQLVNALHAESRG
jgi:hypothetical protein